MKKIIVSLVCFVFAALFSQAAMADNPPAGNKTFADDVCDALKECKTESVKNPTIRYLPQYKCQGDFLPAKSNFAHPCVCAEGKLPYVLNYGWKIVPRLNAQPNTRYYEAVIFCGESPEIIRRDIGLVAKDVQSIFADLAEYKRYVASVFGNIASELKRVEGKADKAQQTAEGADKKAGEADKKAQEALELAMSRPTRAWVYAHSSRLFGGVGVAFLPMASGRAGMGVAEVGWGKLYGDGTLGWRASIRGLYAPGSFSSGLSRQDGQVWGGGGAVHATISPWDDKRLQLLFGPSYTQFWTPNENWGRAGYLGLVEGGVKIPLSEEVVGLQILVGIGQEAYRVDGSQRENGLAGMLSIGLSF